MGDDQTLKPPVWAEPLLARMHRFGITRDALASFVGLSASSVGHYLTGRRDPKNNIYRLMCFVVDLDCDAAKQGRDASFIDLAQEEAQAYVSILSASEDKALIRSTQRRIDDLATEIDSRLEMARRVSGSIAVGRLSTYKAMVRQLENLRSVITDVETSRLIMAAVEAEQDRPMFSGRTRNAVAEPVMGFMLPSGDDKPEEPPGRKLPVISTVAAGNWSEAVDPYQLGDAEAWEYVDGKYGKRAFILRVEGESMTSRHGLSIPPGARVVIDPEVEPYNGAIVVAKLLDDNVATLKKLVIDPPDCFLAPLNPDYSRINLVGVPHKIVGVARKVIQNI